MCKILPITFPTEDVKSILAGRKTSTRKLATFLSEKNPFWSGYTKDGLMLYNGTNEPCIKKAPYSVGDVLYVRETWKPSTTMPKEVARIWLKVTNIRLERLQNISYDDCKKEGIWDDYKTYNNEYTENLRKLAYPKAFSQIWDSELPKSKKEKYCWQNNPWVWVIEFERCEKPEKNNENTTT